MKKARRVEVPEDRPLTKSEYEDFLSHAVNSALWHVNRSRSTAQQVRERLYRKGYPRHSVLVQGASRTFQVNFVEKVVAKLTELSHLDDEAFAQDFLESKLRQGVGLSRARGELLRKGVSPEVVEQAIEAADRSEERETLERLLAREVASSSYRGDPDLVKRKQKVVRRYAAKGFPLGAVLEVLEALETGEDYLP